MKRLLIILLSALAVACGDNKPVSNAEVKLTTTMGHVTVRLSDLTPIHRDNFLQLTEEGYFDGLLFHRVIGNFMIQGGDPRTSNIKGSEFRGVGQPTLLGEDSCRDMLPAALPPSWSLGCST